MSFSSPINISRNAHVLASVLAIAVVAALAAPANAIQDQMQSAGVGTNPSVLVFDQKPDGNTVKLTYVYVPGKSIAAIYQSAANSASGEPLGSVVLERGDHRDVKVQMSTAPKAGEKLWVTIYDDKNGDGKLKAKPSGSYWKASELPTENQFVIR